MNQRKEIRLNGNHTVIIEIQSEGNSQGLLMTCTSVDVSSDGLQVTVNRPLIPEHIYFVTVIPDKENLTNIANKERFHLVAETMWCKPLNKDLGFRIGLKILNSGDEHYLEWKQWVLAALLNLDNN